MTHDASLPTDRVAAAFSVVEALCAQRGIVVTRLDVNTGGVLTVKLHGSSRTWDLYVDCDDDRLALPKLGLGTPRGLIPHVSYEGVICVNDGQGLSIDPDRRTDIAAHTLLAGYDLLEKWSVDAEAGRVEFFNELEGYWSGLPSALRGRATFEVDGNDRLISAYQEGRTKPAKWYFAECGQALPSEFNAEKLQARRCLYIHLDKVPEPPAYPEQLTPAFVEQVRAAMSPQQVELWDSLVGPSKNGPKQIALVISLPRSAGGLSLVGVVFTADRAAVDRRAPVLPLTVRRHTVNYMRERGGASLQLFGKHVAVLGCGAIGAVVADTLAAAGVGRLTLVDHDEFSEDNVFRHVLEPLYIGLPKVLGLKHLLERKYPGFKATAVALTAQKWHQQAKLNEFDGVVLAFGAPSLERSFSRALKDKRHQLPVVFTWLEALDLGGHSVLMWSDTEGCLDCLYRDDEGAASLHPRTSFLLPNQHLTRNLTGCASTFVPFGALQARRTALVAAEHILGAIVGDVREPSYRFWVGEGTEANARGLRMTPWWVEAARTSSVDATKRVFGRPCKRCRGAA